MTATQFFTIFAVLQLLDAVTTFKILKRGGRELNPVMRFFIDRLNPLPALVGTKAGLLLLVWHIPPPLYPQVFLLVFYAAVVINNWRVMQRMDPL